MRSDNPYITPATDPQANPGGFNAGRSWTVVDGTLMVRDGAELPETNFLGPDDGPLVSARQKIGRVSWPAFFIQIPFVLPLLAVGYLTAHGWPPWLPWLVAIIGSVVALAVSRFTTQRPRLSYFVSARTMACRRYLKIAGLVICLIAMAFGVNKGLAVAAVLRIPSTDLWVMRLVDVVTPADLFLFTALLSVGSLTLAFGFRMHGFCRREQDGWFHLSRIPREVVERLGEISRRPL